MYAIRSYYVLAREIEFEMTPEQAAGCQVEREVPELHFCGDLAGYGWLLRKGDWLNVGLGRITSYNVCYTKLLRVP